MFVQYFTQWSEWQLYIRYALWEKGQKHGVLLSYLRIICCVFFRLSCWCLLKRHLQLAVCTLHGLQIQSPVPTKPLYLCWIIKQVCRNWSRWYQSKVEEPQEQKNMWGEEKKHTMHIGEGRRGWGVGGRGRREWLSVKEHVPLPSTGLVDKYRQGCYPKCITDVTEL